MKGILELGLYSFATVYICNSFSHRYLQLRGIALTPVAWAGVGEDRLSALRGLGYSHRMVCE